MLPDERIREIALEVARASLAPQLVNDVLIAPADIWDGADSLWVMTVVPSADAPDLKGPQLVQYVMRHRERLEQDGEHRRPVPRWATPEDLAADLQADDDSES
jgi:hypothetical protein